MKLTGSIHNSFVIATTAFLFLACKETKKEVAADKEIVKEEIVKQKPNIIYILADDLGYGDLSSYGQVNFKTPHIDKLAENGIKFTQHYTGSAVCAPSRSSLMTGLHTGHTPIRGNRELKGQEGQEPIPASSITIAEVLKDAGYTNGAFGKWGLGYIGSTGDPINQGFDEFYGYNCQRQAHRYYPTHLWQNDEKVLLKGNDYTNTVTYAPDLIQKETLRFLEDNKDKPFFAYVPLVLPHAELMAPKDSIFKKYDGKFKEVPHTTKERYTSDYGPDINPTEYSSQDKPYAMYASMVDRLDVYVGQIVAKVKELSIEDNTIIMFASDNGPHKEGGANPAYFNSGGGLRGEKRDLYEGGIRTPFIVVWPNKIKAGTTTNMVSAFWDILPTVADITETTIPAEVDGVSLVPTLLNKGEQKQHDYLYWEFNIQKGRKAVRKGDYKGVWYKMNADKPGNFELYNLKNDEAETTNIADKYPKIVLEMKQLMKDSHTESKLFPFK
ncbi:arylsulfatase [Cellulophaga lytica]|uniref:arylsulfatase n=1 Tax=Cellulophaga lytica TaxID=979 RepID=UPI0026E1236B|nr:arylsulfatase [Cellulophaga lytica]MDO6854118.1 arylsulfatase [Cellulophaga lytica]